MTHSKERQALVARNVAHADTPGYRAVDLKSFADLMQRVSHRENLHSSALTGPRNQIEIAPEGSVSPDGNSVGLEDQMIRAQEAARAHSRAITIYTHSLKQLRTVLGR
ncbi:MAG: hypothetical protein AAFQ36_02785 [Pseudomonadota bacterium]